MLESKKTKVSLVVLITIILAAILAVGAVKRAELEISRTS